MFFQRLVYGLELHEIDPVRLIVRTGRPYGDANVCLRSVRNVCDKSVVAAGRIVIDAVALLGRLTKLI